MLKIRRRRSLHVVKRESQKPSMQLPKIVIPPTNVIKVFLKFMKTL